MSQVEFQAVDNSGEKALADIWFESLPEPARFLEILQKQTKFELLQVKNDVSEVWDFLHFWLIKINNQIVGYLLVSSNQKAYQSCSGKATILELYFPSSFSNHGIGSQALNLVEDFCDDKNLHLFFVNNPKWELFEEKL